MRTVAAFFDLDGTLTSAHVWRGLVRYIKRDPRNLGRYRRFLLTHAPLGLLSRAGLLDPDRLARRWISDMASFLSGFSPQQASDMFQWIMDREIRPGLRAETVETLRWHQTSGHGVILVSGTYQGLLEIVAEELQVEHAIGTQLELVAGVYTGRTAGTVCFGSEKARRAREYLQRNGIEIDLDSSWAYADRLSDLTLLQMVGHPVATFPEPRLRRYAQAKGWPTLGEAQG